MSPRCHNELNNLDITIDIPFLLDGEYKIEIWKDGINVDGNVNDNKKISQTVK